MSNQDPDTPSWYDGVQRHVNEATGEECTDCTVPTVQFYKVPTYCHKHGVRCTVPTVHGSIDFFNLS